MNLRRRLTADKVILLDERSGIWSYSIEVYKWCMMWKTGKERKGRLLLWLVNILCSGRFCMRIILTVTGSSLALYKQKSFLSLSLHLWKLQNAEKRTVSDHSFSCPNENKQFCLTSSWQTVSDLNPCMYVCIVNEQFPLPASEGWWTSHF